MNYAKVPLTFEQQADLLISRGLVGNKTLMIARLSVTNYYRLSGYWYPFREVDQADPQSRLDTFQPGTTFDAVWKRYVFDRHLRLMVLDAIERIEVAIRTQLMYHHAHNHGPFGYATDPGSMPKLIGDRYHRFLERIRVEIKQSKDTFTSHFITKYGDHHKFLPAWMLAEVMSFGLMLTFYKGASKKVKQRVADRIEMPEKVFESWLLTLNVIRNISAHHGRLWNRELGVRPFIPRIIQYPQWHTPVKVGNNRVFGVLSICKWSLDRVAPQSRWSERLCALLEEYSDIPRTSMGFPTNWLDSPIWTMHTAAPKPNGGEDE